MEEFCWSWNEIWAEPKYVRSRQELSNEDPYSNEYLLAKLGVDTAENEPDKDVCLDAGA